MVSLDETFRSLYGAWRLARFDPAGLDYFNVGTDGFWRSFFAAVLVLPLYLILLGLRYQTASEHVPAARFFGIEIIAFIIAWLAFPVVMISVAAAIGREQFFVRYIIANNWASVLQNGVYLPIVILGILGVLPEAASGFLSLVALLWVMAYSWFIARSALDITGGAAAGIVGLDLLISILISTVIG